MNAMEVLGPPAGVEARQEPSRAAGRPGSVPRASIIIVNYNGGELLRRCLRSLFDEDRNDDEVIVVDNASTDGSPDEIEALFPGVHAIRSDANLGFAQGNNLAAGHATGKYLAFLNPDTVVEPGWLDALIAALEADPQAGLATPKILLLQDPERINTCGNDIHYTGLTLCRGMGMDREALAEADDVSAVSGAAFVVRRELFEAVGGFDETFFLYMEDTDLSWRVRLAGYRCLYVPSSIVYHNYTLRFGPQKTFYQERNRYLMLLKGLRWQTFLVLLPALFLGELVTWGFVLAKEPRQLANKWRAYAWIARHWQAIMESRRRTQRIRTAQDRDLLARCTHRLAYEQTGAGLIPRLAHAVFDPLFFVLHLFVLAVARW